MLLWIRYQTNNGPEEWGNYLFRSCHRHEDLALSGVLPGIVGQGFCEEGDGGVIMWKNFKRLIIILTCPAWVPLLVIACVACLWDPFEGGYFG